MDLERGAQFVSAEVLKPFINGFPLDWHPRLFADVAENHAYLDIELRTNSKQAGAGLVNVPDPRAREH